MAQDASTLAAPAAPAPTAPTVVLEPAPELITHETMLQGNDALALTKMGFGHMIQAADAVGLLTLGVLAAMSIGCWYFIIYKALRLSAARRRARAVIEAFWDSPSPKDAMEMLREQPEYEPISKVALEAIEAAQHHADAQGGRMAEALSRQEFIERALRAVLKREGTKFDSGQTLLASVGSTAPFVGLFGTVWGIYHALINIGNAGQASLDVVAGPVGEALIMTCIGLGVAIPAVLAYNAFVRANRDLVQQMTTFANDLLDFFATGQRIRIQKYGSQRDEGRAAARI